MPEAKMLYGRKGFLRARWFYKMKQKKTNEGWRIKSIPYGDQFQPMETNWWAVVGFLCFIAGITLFLLQKQLLWMILSVVGFLIGLGALLLKGRRIRRNWELVQAKCIDQEVRHIHSPRPGRRKVWCFQLLCEFELNGCTYRVTPFFWRSFATEAGLSNFLSRAISSEGWCELHVNPDNPLQTELIGHDIKEALMHGGKNQQMH